VVTLLHFPAPPRVAVTCACAETLLEPPQYQATKHGVDFPGRQLRALVEPPAQHGDEPAGDVLRRQISRLPTAFEGERRQIGRGEIRDHALNAVHDDRAAPTTRHGLPQLQMAVRMLEHHDAEAETTGLFSLSLADEAPQVFQSAVEQRVLVGEVCVERRATHVRRVDDVLNGRGGVALLDHHRDQRILEQLARALHTPVMRSLCHVASRSNALFPPVPKTEQSGHCCSLSSAPPCGIGCLPMM